MVYNCKNHFKICAYSFFTMGCLFVAACENEVHYDSMILNIPYHEARKVIIQNGWKPLPQDRDDYDDLSSISRFLDMGYVEVDACSGTGKGYCKFYFTNENGTFLSIITQEAPVKGFDPDIDNTNGAIVVSYSIDDAVD